MSVTDFEKILKGPLLAYLNASKIIDDEVAEHSNYVQRAFEAQLEYLKHANKSKMPTEAEQEELFMPTYQVILAALNYQQTNQDFLAKVCKMSVANFLHIIHGPLARYHLFSQQIGGDVAIQSALVTQAFQTQLQHLIQASCSEAPSSEEILTLVQPTGSCITIVQDIKNKNHNSPYLNHLSAISEGVTALGWTALIPAPIPFLMEIINSVQHYTNQILNDWKQKDNIHVDWTAVWLQTLTDLLEYVKQYHPAGLKWGGMPTSSLESSQSDFVDMSIPPPLECPLLEKYPEQSSYSEYPPVLSPAIELSDTVGLESRKKRPTLSPEIKQIQKINKKLRKINEDLEACRSLPQIMGISASSEASTSIIKSNPVITITPKDKSPVFVKTGNKWLIVMGKVSSIVVDKTDGCQMYLSRRSLKVEVISTKSSELNLLVPLKNGDYEEFAIPVQNKTVITSRGLETNVVNIYKK
ncbi:hypothetical protein ILUMI_23281 [Ignelater luminosus]|uniref:Uncharacterized protein n=1 Tax=Ignelater luminosus TaxID=2038154 RepID=A0A8K0CFL0_IGNLU|nr:hypothetical protein ILUMI_23281 [Ignelater luminosus]